MANFGSVFMGTIAGMVGAGAMFYGITLRQAFGGTTPVDQDEAWQVKSEDLMMEGKWVRFSMSATCRKDCFCYTLHRPSRCLSMLSARAYFDLLSNALRTASTSRSEREGWHRCNCTVA